MAEIERWVLHATGFSPARALYPLRRPSTDTSVVPPAAARPSLCPIADKYQARGILLELLSQAQRSDREWAPSVLALSILYEHTPTTIAALRLFDITGGVCCVGRHHECVCARVDFTFHDMSLELLKHVRHTNAFLYLLAFKLVLLDPFYDGVKIWAGAIETLTCVSATHLLLAALIL